MRPIERRLRLTRCKRAALFALVRAHEISDECTPSLMPDIGRQEELSLRRACAARLAAPGAIKAAPLMPAGRSDVGLSPYRPRAILVAS
jgi:hypothetical protein